MITRRARFEAGSSRRQSAQPDQRAIHLSCDIVTNETDRARAAIMEAHHDM
jgi:hypothetical protein